MCASRVRKIIEEVLTHCSTSLHSKVRSPPNCCAVLVDRRMPSVLGLSRVKKTFFPTCHTCL